MEEGWSRKNKSARNRKKIRRFIMNTKTERKYRDNDKLKLRKYKKATHTTNVKRGERREEMNDALEVKV